MANNGSNWSFGAQGNSGTSNLFGQSTSKPPTTNLFGTANNSPVSSAPNAFAGTSTAPSSGTSLFGTANTNQGNNLFGGGGGSAGGVGAFGAGSQSNSAGFNFGPNQQPKSPATSQASNLFGGGTTSGAGLFGNAGGNTSIAAPFGNATPTSKPTSGLFGNPSTTPAGPPPSNLSFGLGSTTQQPQSSAPNSANAPATSNNSGGSTLFGNASSTPAGGLFPSSQPTESKPPATSSQSSTSIFSQPAGSASSGLFGNKPEAQPIASLFSNLGKQNDPSFSPLVSTPQSEASKPLFPNIGEQSTAPTTSAQTSAPSLFSNAATNAGSNASKPSFSFPTSTSKPAESSTPTTTAPNFFSLGAQSATTSSSAPAPASTSANSLFSNLSKPAEKPTETAGGTSATSGPSLTAAPASSSNPFSFPSLTPASANQPSTTKAAEPISATTAAGKSTLGASTTGPAPAPQSRLKNKSMDEIITRWASDLSKYQKEFQRQAEKVAAWDRMLVENSDKIQKLYGSTLEAQRATSEVERQLTLVENEQSDLERELDAYERQVDEMIADQQGLGDSFQGPDVERQKMYELAEKVKGRLDEMGKDLSSMIEEINDASSSLNKNNKPDDPLSQVVRVLNSHLTQLQQIDQGTAALHLKVTAAQKTGVGMGSSGGYAGPSSDAADGFYQSFMGRR